MDTRYKGKASTRLFSVTELTCAATAAQSVDGSLRAACLFKLGLCLLQLLVGHVPLEQQQINCLQTSRAICNQYAGLLTACVNLVKPVKPEGGEASKGV